MNVIVEKKKRIDYLNMAENMDWSTALVGLATPDPNRSEATYIAVAYAKGYEDAIKYAAENEKKGKKSLTDILKSVKEKLHSKKDENGDEVGFVPPDTDEE